MDQHSDEQSKNPITRRRALGQLAVGGAIMAFAPQILAQPSERKSQRKQIRENEQNAKHMEALVAEAEAYIVINDDGTLGLQEGTSPTLEVQQLIQASMAELNPRVQGGEIVIEKNLDIRSLRYSPLANATGVQYFWWGRRWALNSTQTNRLIAALVAGAAISQFFPGAGQVVALILGLGAAVIMWYASPGTGIYIYDTWFGPDWITSQPR